MLHTLEWHRCPQKCQEIYQSARCHFEYFDLSSQLGGDMQKLRGQVSEDMILHGKTFELLFSAVLGALEDVQRFNKTMALPLLVGQT